MEVRCPQCHSPIDLSDDTPLSDIACPSCGGSFRLLGEETQTYQAAVAKTIGHFELMDQVSAREARTPWAVRVQWSGQDNALNRGARQRPRLWAIRNGRTIDFPRCPRA